MKRRPGLIERIEHLLWDRLGLRLANVAVGAAMILLLIAALAVAS
ncbi:hypothetical protein [Panacagrimonas sp.]